MSITLTYSFASPEELSAFVAAKIAPKPPQTVSRPVSGVGGTVGTTRTESATKFTKAQMQAALDDVKTKIGMSAAKVIIKAAGFQKMADISEAKYDQVYEACKKKMSEAEEVVEETSDDGDGL